MWSLNRKVLHFLVSLAEAETLTVTHEVDLTIDVFGFGALIADLVQTLTLVQTQGFLAVGTLNTNSNISKIKGKNTVHQIQGFLSVGTLPTDSSIRKVKEKTVQVPIKTRALMAEFAIFVTGKVILL